MKRGVRIFLVIIIVVICLGMMKNSFLNKPLQLEESVQDWLNLKGFGNCHLVKFGGSDSIVSHEISPCIIDEEIEKYIEYILQENAYRRHITNRNLVQIGDLALADYRIMNGTEQVNSVEDAPIRVGSGYYDTYLESAIVGLETGKEYVIDWQVPDDVDNIEWAQKELKIHIVIKELYEVLTPSVEEYALQNGFESTEQYKEHVKIILLEDKEKELKNNVIDSVIQVLIDNSKFQIDEEVTVENAIQYYYEYNDLAYIYDTSLEEFIRSSTSGEYDVYTICYEKSMQEIQKYLIIGRYAQEEEIEISEKEIKEYYKKNNIDEEKISEDELIYVKYQLVEKKVFNSIVDKYVE